VTKGNAFGLRLASPTVIERELRTSASDDVFGWTVRRLTQLDALRALDLGRSYVERFVDGDEALPPVAGQPVVVSRTACMVVAALEAAQCGPEADRYSVFEIFAQLLDPELCEQLSELHDAIQTEERRPDPLAAPSSSTASSGG
jgi:hypothetical protein